VSSSIKIKKIFTFIFVALFVSYYVNMHFFPHVHSIGGATIIHSHIHANSHHDTDSGGHTEHSIILISQISQSEYISFSCNYVPIPSQFSLHINKIIETSPWVVSTYLENLSLRAPPIV